jgi:Ca-activated chloride channel homolog
MNWGAPSYLLMLGGVAMLALSIALGAWRHRTVLARLFAPGILERVLPRSVRVRRGLRDLGRLAGLALVVVALAEPRFDKQIRTVSSRGADVMLIVDLSRSMDAKDVDPSRLQRARREVADLAKVVEGDRVGLVVFSGGAYLRLPLTADLVALQNVLAVADTSTFQAQGSALGAAIDEALSGLKRSEGQAGQAILVLSDGEIHNATEALAAADRAVAANVAIYAMGIGIEPSPIPLADGTWLKDRGQQVLTTPDFTVLKAVAERTGGAFVQSVASPRDIEGLYTGEIRRKLVTVERSSSQRETWRAAFQWPLGVGLGLWLLGSWLGDGRRVFGAASLIAAMWLGAFWAPAAMAADVADADRLFRSERFAEAAEQLTELSLEQPGDAEIFDRLGAARYRNNDFDGASRAWDEASRLRGGDPNALYNSGNANYRSGRLEDALDRYQQALDKDPAHGPSVANKELVNKALEARRQKPPPQQGEGKNEDENDSDKQDGEDSEGGEGSKSEGGEPQEGEPQEGEPGEGEGEPQAGQPENPQGEGEPKDGSTDAGEPTEGEPEEGEGSQSTKPEDLDSPEGEPSEATPGGEGGGIPTDEEGPITEGQAERLLDGIEEGSQRVYVRGKGEDKPW